MKKLLVLSLTVAAVAWLVLASFFVVWKGPWMDRLVSKELGQHLGLRIEMEGARIEGWSRLSFDGLKVIGRSGKTFVTSGHGRMRFYGIDLFARRFDRIETELSDVAVMRSLLEKVPVLAWASKDALGRPVRIRSVQALMHHGQTGALEVHLTQFDSAELALFGGMQVANRKLLKANALVLLPSDVFERVPKELRARMIRRPRGWRGVRITYNERLLTAWGATGRFFSASWETAPPRPE